MVIFELWVFLLGASLGSFFEVCAYRIPKQENFIVTRSFCPQCKHSLGAKDLIPIISYVVLQGRCRYCKGAIATRCLISELLSGLIFLALFVVFGFSPEFVLYGTLAGLLMVGALVDLDHLYIPDGLVLLGIILGAGLNLLTGYGDIQSAIVGLMAGAIPLLLVLLVSKGGMGLGDVKFGAMLGVFLGWKLTLIGLFLAFFAGALVGVLLLLSGTKNPKDPIPFGPFLAFGSILASLWGHPLIAMYFRLTGI